MSSCELLGSLCILASSLVGCRRACTTHNTQQELRRSCKEDPWLGLAQLQHTSCLDA